MVANIIVIFYILFFVSMVCATYTASKLYLSGKNYLIAVLAGAMAFGELNILLSVIWIEDFHHNVPKAFCIYQALVFQFAVYLQIIAAVCFSHHIYQLLVNYKQRVTDNQRRIYVGCIVVGPIIMTIIASIVSIKTDAIGPLALNCDIKKPIWVRLVGYSGFNLALTFPGVYLSSRAAFQVFRHLDRFKSNMSYNAHSNSGASTTNLTSMGSEVQITVSTATETTSYTTFRRPPVPDDNAIQRQARAYDLTKTAAIRMVLFACGFALINVSGAFQTINSILHGINIEDNSIGGNDLAGGLMGIMIFAVFGLPGVVKKLFSRRKE